MNNFFNIQKIGDGIWAAIASPGSGAMCNAAIVDLGEITIVVDTFCVPQAGALLREAAEQLTGRKVKYVINTHFHGDHHYGNQEFCDSTIITSNKIREKLIEGGQPPIDQWQDGLREHINSLKRTRDMRKDERVKRAFQFEIDDKENLYKAVPSIKWRPATVVFEDSMEIIGSKRRARVLTYGGGHTISDVFVHLPDDRVLIAGDLVLGNAHPAMLNGNINEWDSILKRIDNELDIITVIPGHGGVQGRESIKKMRNYIKDIELYAMDAVKRGEGLEYYLEKGAPYPYDQWELPHVFEWNFNWLYNFYDEKK